MEDLVTPSREKLVDTHPTTQELKLFQINPKKFHEALAKAGFYEAIYAGGETPLQDQSMLGMIANAQEILMKDVEMLPATQKSIIDLVGQNHDFQPDEQKAKDYAQKSASDHGTLVLEGDGDVRRKNPTCLIEIGKKGCELIITEHELYDINTKSDSLDLLVRRKRPPMSDRFRSWIVAMYLVNLIIEKPGRSITVIFGENHIMDIRQAVYEFLKYIGYPIERITIGVAKSYDSTTEMTPPRPFSTEELRSGCEQWKKKLSELTHPTAISQPETPTASSFLHEESKKKFSSGTLSTYKQLKQKWYLSTSESLDLDEFIAKTAKSHDIPSDSLRQKLVEWEKAYQGDMFHNILMEQVYEIAEQAYTERESNSNRVQSTLPAEALAHIEYSRFFSRAADDSSEAKTTTSSLPLELSYDDLLTGMSLVDATTVNQYIENIVRVYNENFSAEEEWISEEFFKNQLTIHKDASAAAGNYDKIIQLVEELADTSELRLTI